MAPVHSPSVVVYESLSSTQDTLIDLIESEQIVTPKVVATLDQTKGRGRFQRTWVAKKNQSLSFSMVLPETIQHPTPWVIGLQIALIVAKQYGCQVSWPNDIMYKNKKAGGILTDLVHTTYGHIPVVGIGVNLGDVPFPESLKDSATSLGYASLNIDFIRSEINKILKELYQQGIASSWQNIQDEWLAYDITKLKTFHDKNLGPLQFQEYKNDGSIIVKDSKNISHTFLASEYISN